MNPALSQPHGHFLSLPGLVVLNQKLNPEQWRHRILQEPWERIRTSSKFWREGPERERRGFDCACCCNSLAGFMSQKKVCLDPEGCIDKTLMRCQIKGVWLEGTQQSTAGRWTEFNEGGREKSSRGGTLCTQAEAGWVQPDC